MRRSMFLFLVLLAVISGSLYAQTPPCGIGVFRTEGPKVDERFVAGPPEQVKAAVLKALPAVTAKVHKDEGLEIEAETDKDLYQTVYQMNKKAGVHGITKGLGASGKFTISIREATQDGVSGSILHIEFHKHTAGNGGYAQPLTEETTCLVKVLTMNDLTNNPRGLQSNQPAPARAIALPEGTPLKLVLPSPLYSKTLQKDNLGEAIQFEVAEDVLVDGAVAVRRGALATGHFTNVKKVGAYGRSAEIGFAFDTVTAVDGQKIPLAEVSQKARAGPQDNVAGNVAADELLGGPLAVGLGWMEKGFNALIPAGTSYDVETSGEHTIQSGR